MSRRLELLIALSDEMLIVTIVLAVIMYFLNMFGIIGLYEAIAVSVVVLTFFLWISYKIFKAHYTRPSIGAEALVGKIGEVIEPPSPEGIVMVEGELWRFKLEEVETIKAGDKVLIVGYNGLVLRAKRVKHE